MKEQNIGNKRKEYLEKIAAQERKTSNMSKHNSDEFRHSDKKNRRSDNVFLHYATPVIVTGIIVVLGCIVFLIIRWSRGTDLNISDVELSEDYSSESLDWYSYFNPYDVPGYEDDGKMNIVILGDDSIYSFNDETGIPALIREATGANVTAIALPRQTWCLSTDSYSLDNPEQAFSFVYLAQFLSLHDYDLLSKAAPLTDNESIYRYYVAKLYQTDFGLTDILILCLGRDDYLEARALSQSAESIVAANGSQNYNNLQGAMVYGFQALQRQFPYMQLIICSPSYFMIPDENGNLVGADVTSNGVSTLADYISHMSGVCNMISGVTFVDNYYGFEINETTAGKYLEPDMLYPNAEGRKLIADHILEFLYFIRNNQTAE